MRVDGGGKGTRGYKSRLEDVTCRLYGVSPTSPYLVPGTNGPSRVGPDGLLLWLHCRPFRAEKTSHVWVDLPVVLATDFPPRSTCSSVQERGWPGWSRGQVVW